MAGISATIAVIGHLRPLAGQEREEDVVWKRHPNKPTVIKNRENGEGFQFDGMVGPTGEKNEALHDSVGKTAVLTLLSGCNAGIVCVGPKDSGNCFYGLTTDAPGGREVGLSKLHCQILSFTIVHLNYVPSNSVACTFQ
jgi:hypothetical protein